MTKRPGYTLQRTMIIYFLLIAAASLMVSAEFVMDTQSASLRQGLMEGFERYTRAEIPREEIFQPIVRLRHKALLMMGTVLIVTVIVLLMFIKTITEPLQHMIGVARRISSGDLSRAVSVQTANELATLSQVINDMTSNLQELILLSGNLMASAERLGEAAGGILQEPRPGPAKIREARETLARMESEAAMLAEMLACFQVYRVEAGHAP
jgi:methyl-accepting chemotaxis protein